jgi:putative transposase
MSRRKTGLGARGRGFNRAVLDAGMGTTRRLLGYKTDWYGSELVVADRWYPSSKTCSACAARKSSLHLSERTYDCTSCGASLDRDLNAAINLARLASGPSTRSGREDANSGQREVDETDPRRKRVPHGGGTAR